MGKKNVFKAGIASVGLLSTMAVSALLANNVNVYAEEAASTTESPKTVDQLKNDVATAQNKVDAAQANLTTATANVSTAQTTVDSETAGLEQAKKDLAGQPADLVSGELSRRTKLVQDATNDLAAAKTLAAQAQAELDSAKAELEAAQKALADASSQQKAVVKVRVVNNAHNPVAGAKVEFSTDGFSSGSQVETDANGYATFEAEVGTKVQARVAFVPEGYDFNGFKVELTAEAGKENEDFITVNKQAEPEAEKAVVKVRVVNNAHNPVAGAKVEFTTDGFSTGHQVETDANGYATFEAEVGTKVQARVAFVPEGYDFNGFKVELTAEAGKENEDFITVNKQAEPEAEKAVVKVRVVDNAHNPVAGAKVEFSTDGFSSGHQVETDANGYATFEAEVGTKVQARLASVPEGYDYNSFKVELTAEAGKENEDFIAVDKKQSPTNTPDDDSNNNQEALPALVVIQVVDNAHQGVAGVTVEFSTDGFSTGHQYVTDANGYVTFEAKDGDKVQARLANVPEGVTYNAYVETVNVTAEGDNSGFIAVDKAQTPVTPTPPVKPEVKPTTPEVKPEVKPETPAQPEVKPEVKPETPAQPEVKPEENKDVNEAKDSKETKAEASEAKAAELPNTGVADSFTVFGAAAAAIISGLGLAVPGKKND